MADNQNSLPGEGGTPEGFDIAPNNPPAQSPQSPPEPVTRPETQVQEDFRGANVPGQAPSFKIRTMKEELDSAGNTPSTPDKIITPPSQPGISVPPPPAQPEEPVFNPGNRGGSPGISQEFEEESGGKKKLFIIIGVVLGIVILALVGYFVIIPIIFPPLATEPAPALPNETAPVTQPTPIVPVVAPMTVHQSYFLTTPADTTDINLSSIDQLSTLLSLAGYQDPLAQGQVREVVFRKTQGDLTFAEIMNNVSVGNPSPLNPDLFESDFTAFLYYDASSAWGRDFGVFAGYIVELKNNTTSDQVLTEAKKLEGNLKFLDALYVTPPVTPREPVSFSEFKDGQAKGASTRYSVAGTPGGAFNYGIFGNYFVMSTSYNGLLAALNLLGI